MYNLSIMRSIQHNTNIQSNIIKGEIISYKDIEYVVIDVDIYSEQHVFMNIIKLELFIDICKNSLDKYIFNKIMDASSMIRCDKKYLNVCRHDIPYVPFSIYINKIEKLINVYV